MHPQVKKDTVLILAGNEELAKNAQIALGENYEYLRTFNTAEALSEITYNIPALIIAENNEPDINGLEFLKMLRCGIKTKLIPFIVISPKDEINDRITATEMGADAYLLHPFIPEELTAIVRARLSKFKEFYLLSITDELTRLYNRREFIKIFQNEINSCESNRHVSLAILDIDMFKMVNDKYGHQTGDRVLMTLAEMLKDKTSESFFPARFGGEEFVILLSRSDADQTKKIMETLLHEFSSTVFEFARIQFYVTFSAGISEYPSMGKNISELLSRADQALYAAKEDGRNRVYAFSPIMSRNDKFWEYLKVSRGNFIDARNCDPVSKIPYLPNLLETVSNLDFKIRSVGIMIIKVIPCFDIAGYTGLQNFHYDIENIKKMIYKSCQMVFPSDTYMGLSDLYDYEFILLFPSVADFFFNLHKFNSTCLDIGHTISLALKYFPVDISLASSVLTLDTNCIRNIYDDIKNIRTSFVDLSWKRREFSDHVKQFSLMETYDRIEDFIVIKNFYDRSSYELKYHYLAMKTFFPDMDIFSPLLDQGISDITQFENFVEMIAERFKGKISAPLLFPWLPSIYILDYIDIISSRFQGVNVIILLNESHLCRLKTSGISTLFEYLPENISFGIDNCYIGSDILSLLSIYDFKMLIFSENITRNIHMAKDRIKIISGLKIFLDQLGICAMVKNIVLEEEYEVMADLNISSASGHLVDEKRKLNL